MSKQKSIEEIVNETVEWYTKNPRSSVEDVEDSDTPTGCYYFHPEKKGAMCAFGRCMDQDNDFVKSIKGDPFGRNNADSLSGILTASGYQTDDLLKPEYQGHPSGFWSQLQVLHDNDFNWDENNGLTERGITWKEHLLTRYGAKPVV